MVQLVYRLFHHLFLFLHFFIFNNSFNSSTLHFIFISFPPFFYL
nr:MAG TPA: Mucin-1-catalytic proteolysis, STRUCTURAL PROTEIN [Caudoviricetes sp.]